MMRLVGVFGGSFDPVHCGHLRALLEMRDALALDETRVVPCGTPPHRATPVAPPAARVAMLRSALSELPGCVVDEREISREGPSYTVDTLESLRGERPDAAVCLLLGEDAFRGLSRWHRWQDLFELAHIAVARRRGGSGELSQELAEAIRARRCEDPALLRDEPAGRVTFCATSQLEISSSHLRAQAAAGRSLRWLVPPQVEALIDDNGWYREDRRGDD